MLSLMNDRDRRQINELCEMVAAERERCAIAEGRADELAQQLTVAQNNFEWARVRLNQVEAERATLIAHFLKIPIVPMVLAREFESSSALPDLGGVSFDDLGDDAARREGVDHEH
jgi:hypothetical protein